LIVIAANIAASGVDRLLAWVATTLASVDPGLAGQVVNFVGIARIVPALRHLAGTLLLHLAAMAKVIVFILQAEALTLSRCYCCRQRKQQ